MAGLGPLKPDRCLLYGRTRPRSELEESFCRTDRTFLRGFKTLFFPQISLEASICSRRTAVRDSTGSQLLSLSASE